MPDPRRPSRLAGWAWFLLAWLAMGLAMAAQWLPYRERMGVPGWIVVLNAMVYNFLWAALWPVASRVVREGVRGGWRWPAQLGVQLPAAVALSVVHDSTYYGYYRLVKQATGFDSYKAGWLDFLSGVFGFSLLLCGLVVAAAHLIELRRMLDERQRRAEALQEQLVVAQLTALEMQLQPHFLFNTLNSIQALMEIDVRGAQLMVSRLAGFLRATLSVPPDGMVPLRRELELAESYLHIEKVRFPDRLDGEVRADAAAQDLLVPALILQPLIENAVRHGIAPYLRPGRIRVRAEAAAGALRLSVWDSGPGMPAAGADSPGIGLANVRERLRRQYAGAASLRLGNDPDGGFEALITIPVAA